MTSPAASNGRSSAPRAGRGQARAATTWLDRDPDLSLVEGAFLEVLDTAYGDALDTSDWPAHLRHKLVFLRARKAGPGLAAITALSQVDPGALSGRDVTTYLHFIEANTGWWEHQRLTALRVLAQSYYPDAPATDDAAATSNPGEAPAAQPMSPLLSLIDSRRLAVMEIASVTRTTEHAAEERLYVAEVVAPGEVFELTGRDLANGRTTFAHVRTLATMTAHLPGRYPTETHPQRDFRARMQRIESRTRAAARVLSVSSYRSRLRAVIAQETADTATDDRHTQIRVTCGVKSWEAQNNCGTMAVTLPMLDARITQDALDHYTAALTNALVNAYRDLAATHPEIADHDANAARDYDREQRRSRRGASALTTPSPSSTPDAACSEPDEQLTALQRQVARAAIDATLIATPWPSELDEAIVALLPRTSAPGRYGRDARLDLMQLLAARVCRDAVTAYVVRDGERQPETASDWKPVSIEIGVVMSADTLLGVDEAPAYLTGSGRTGHAGLRTPVPAALGRLLAADGAWRRLVSDPMTGALLDRGSRTYTPGSALRAYIAGRDQTCRVPWCNHNAARSDQDHAINFNHHDPGRGGPTTRLNLGALCRHHHLIKSLPRESGGWTLTVDKSGPTPTATWTSPRGGVHRWTAPPVLPHHDPPDDVDLPPDDTPPPF